MSAQEAACRRDTLFQLSVHINIFISAPHHMSIWKHLCLPNAWEAIGFYYHVWYFYGLFRLLPPPCVCSQYKARQCDRFSCLFLTEKLQMSLSHLHSIVHALFVLKYQELNDDKLHVCALCFFLDSVRHLPGWIWWHGDTAASRKGQ